MVISGEKRHARDYLEGLDILASMRLCASPGAIRDPDRTGRLPEHDDLGGPAVGLQAGDMAST